MEGVSVIRLGCVGCGAALDIGSDVNQLACSHCGTSQMVQRDGGTIHLKEVAHALSRVQAGTDKTAAELAIVRLTKERDEWSAKLRSAEEDHRKRTDYWTRTWETRLAESSRDLNYATMAAGIAGGLVGGLVSFLILSGLESLSGRTFDAPGPLAAFVMVLILISGLVTRSILRRHDRFNRDHLIDERQKENSTMEGQMATARVWMNGKIQGLESQIAKNRKVSDS